MNAVITGSTKGIGRAVLLALAKEGWNVAATSRNLEDLEALQEEVTRTYPGQECLIHWVDFAEKEETLKYGEDIKAIWPQIDLLVNNVGVFLPGSVHGEEDGALESTMALNLYSPYYLTRTLLPGMISRKRGTSSICVRSQVSCPIPMEAPIRSANLRCLVSAKYCVKR